TQAGQAWRWTATKDLVERLRAAKGPGEVAAIRSAAELAGAALRDTLPQVRVGMTELEVAGVLEGALRRLGSEGHPFSTIVASGPRTALPHARSSARAVATGGGGGGGEGEGLLLDFGARVDGYCADITRPVLVGGRATERQRAVCGLGAGDGAAAGAFEGGRGSHGGGGRGRGGGVVAAGFRRAGRRLLRRHHPHGAGRRPGDGAAADVVRAGVRRAAAGPRRRACGDERAGRRRAGARADRGARPG